jgi:hypothetical protein
MHAPSVLCRPSGHAADVRTNANTYTRGVEPLCSPCPTARTRARDRARQRGRPSPCRRFAPPRCATPSLTTAQRACRPYHALVLVGRAVDAMTRMLALSPLVPPTRRRFVHRRGSLLPVGPATSSPWVDAGHDRSSLYPISALASLLMLRVLLCPTTGAPTPVWGGCRHCARNRAAEPSSSPEVLPLSRLRRRPSCSRRRGRATGTHARQPNRRLARLERNRSIQIATTPSLYFTAENVLPPGRTSVRPIQCSCSPTRTHAGEHPGVPPGSSPFCAPTSCELRPSPPTFSSLPGKPCS